MAYASSVSQPYVIAGGLAGAGANTATASTNIGALLPNGIGGGTIWGYRSTDTITTVVGSSYFTNGYQLGMRIGDPVFVIDTGQGSTLGISLAVVNSICTTPVSALNGVTLFCGTLHST